MGSSSYSFDVELFIGEVHQQPSIWNATLCEYKHASTKKRAWSSIARVFIDDFDDMTATEKTDVLRKLQCKWRNIRDSYVRYVRRPEPKTKYTYAKNLHFLDIVYKREATENEATAWQSDDEQPLKKRPSLWNTESKPTIKPQKAETNEEYIEYVDTNSPGNTVFNSEDDDRSFFESLLPAVRGFSLDDKLEFRSQVLALIKNIRQNS